MEEMKQTTVVMTAEEKAEFEAFQREKAKKAAEEKAKNDREMYKQMVDEEIATPFRYCWASVSRSRQASRL